MAKILNFRVLIEQDEDGIFVASVPAIPGCHTQGDSYEEVVIKIKEAISLCLEVAKQDKKYYQKIDWDEGKSRFLGVTEVPVKFIQSS
jgi:predicted RNase H-like HicB family nuclease